jgi:predicted nuclease of restriction endonuclease-like RecB superfamily
MLTGKLIRIKHARNKLVPAYLDAENRGWLTLAEQLLFAYRDAAGHTRGEIEEELSDLIGQGPRSLIPAGLAKLLEDRCEFDVVSDHPPEELREAAFRIAATQREGATFDRDAVIAEAAEGFGLTPENLDRSLFADLKDEQRVLTFADCTPEWLLHRYNVALAQGILIRSTDMEVRVWGETPARFRQLFRAVKFHRLICTIHSSPGNSYTLKLDGPLSLFSSSQKYGLQLALFLPTLLHCKAFELSANVRWGTERKEKLFTLAATDGLRSHAPDFGTYTPPELAMFAESFTEKVKGWTLTAEPNPVPLDDGVWVPDFKLVQAKTKKEVYVEIFGFWRKGGVDALYQRLHRAIPGKFVICVSGQLRAEDEKDAEFREGIYHYKRTPLPDEVAKMAAAVAGISHR